MADECQDAQPDVESTPAMRPRASSSEPQIRIPNIPGGIRFFALINRRGRVFIPSTKNYFGAIKVNKVLCDSGCSTLLIPIETNEILREIFSVYQDELSYRFEITRSSGVGGISLCLKISKFDNSNFELHVGQDILGERGGLHAAYLRFSLCTEDILTICEDNQYFSRFLVEDQTLLANATNSRIPRRSHALLGQHVLFDLSSIKHRDCEIYFDASDFTFPGNVRELERILRTISQPVKENLPIRFNEWEDDDFHFDDAEDVFVEDQDN